MHKLIARKENIFGDNIAYLESYDFSKANMSNESRLDVITLVASICYQSPKSHGSESLYNRLMAESAGLPSSSFEMVPMLFDYDQLRDDVYALTDVTIEDTNMLKYGERIEDGRYLLTNFRAVVYDFENLGIDLRDHFNTETECAIIAKHFKVFKMKVDMPTFGQAVRHRVNWQVLSRRYVSGTRVPFDFYIAKQMKKVTTYFGYTESGSSSNELDTEDVIDICISHYKAALEAGVKPQVARGIIPQCAYTVAWCAMQPKQYDSFIKLRSDSHAQWEITQIACAMRDLSEISH
jgi:thymidylate synthase (FAD)